MTQFYFCSTCETVIAGFASKHRDEGHTVRDISDMENRITLGIARDPNATTSSTNEASKMSINGVRKSAIFIGKSGKEVKSRRELSRVAVKYDHIDVESGTATDISEQDFYRLLLANGLPDPSLFHTCSKSQSGAGYFLRRLITSASNNNRFAHVTADIDDKSKMMFTQDNGYGGDISDLARPYASFFSHSYNPYRTNATEEQRKHMYVLDGHEKEIYYDLLAPREDKDGVPYLTRILITVVHGNDIISEYKLDDTRQFILYELSRDEIIALDSRTSFDWASSIVQDARSILC